MRPRLTAALLITLSAPPLFARDDAIAQPLSAAEQGRSNIARELRTQNEAERSILKSIRSLDRAARRLKLMIDPLRERRSLLARRASQLSELPKALPLDSASVKTGLINPSRHRVISEGGHQLVVLDTQALSRSIASGQGAIDSRLMGLEAKLLPIVEGLNAELSSLARSVLERERIVRELAALSFNLERPYSRVRKPRPLSDSTLLDRGELASLPELFGAPRGRPGSDPRVLVLEPARRWVVLEASPRRRIWLERVAVHIRVLEGPILLDLPAPQRRLSRSIDRLASAANEGIARGERTIRGLEHRSETLSDLLRDS